MARLTILFCVFFLLLLGCAVLQPLSAHSPLPASITIPLSVLTPGTTGVLQPSDFRYLGALRLPVGGERPKSFEYGGNAMTFNPAGDSHGPADGFSGSLFITGHDRLPYGELPDGNQVAEVNIPPPTLSGDRDLLNRAEFLQGFHDVAADLFSGLDEIPRIGMLYLNHPDTGPKIHLAWGQHLHSLPFQPSHAWFNPDLETPDIQGAWFIGGQSPYSTTGYMLEIPADWADRYTGGRVIGTGRFRDGGWSGMGPALFAYRPWVDGSGTPAPSGSHLPETVLLQYESSENTDRIERNLIGYQHPDEWEGGAWIVTSGGRSTVLFAGTKSIGEKYWYGYVNPAGPDLPCVDDAFVGEFTVCRMADGRSCPDSDLAECSGHNDYRGWWSNRFEGQFLLYDPAELAQVAIGEKQPWEPQPYAVLDIDPVLFHNPVNVEPEMLGTGDQRRYRIGDAAYDRTHQILYILELFADGAQPVVHAWKIQ